MEWQCEGGMARSTLSIVYALQLGTGAAFVLFSLARTYCVIPARLTTPEQPTECLQYSAQLTNGEVQLEPIYTQTNGLENDVILLALVFRPLRTVMQSALGIPATCIMFQGP